MGRGNFRLRDRVLYNQDCEMVYIEYPIFEEPSECEFNFWYDDLRENIRFLLPDSFTDFENKFVKIGFHDNEWSLAVVIEPAENVECSEIFNLYKSYVERFSKKFFDKLNRMYPLKIRCSAWTSGIYE